MRAGQCPWVIDIFSGELYKWRPSSVRSDCPNLNKPACLQSGRKGRMVSWSSSSTLCFEDPSRSAGFGSCVSAKIQKRPSLAGYGYESVSFQAWRTSLPGSRSIFARGKSITLLQASKVDPGMVAETSGHSEQLEAVRERPSAPAAGRQDSPHSQT